MEKQKDIIEFIKTIKESFVGAETVFCYGSCYSLYLILKRINNNAIPLINEEGQHIITNIGDDYYDINGLFLDHQNFRPLTEIETLYFKERKFNIFSPDFFIPEWVIDCSIPFLQTAQFAFNLGNGYKLVKIENDEEYDKIEKALFTVENNAYEEYTEELQKEQSNQKLF